MAVHRTMITTQSAAEARLRDNRIPQQNTANYHSCNSPAAHVNDFSSWSPCGSRSISSFSKYRSDLNHRADSYSLIAGPDDPARLALLPPTHYHGIDSPISDYELGDYHRLAPRVSSGVYLGVLLLTIIWLLPLGIIISGETTISAQEIIHRFTASNITTFEPLTWENMRRAEHCLRFKTRKYTAKSVGTSPGRSGVVECEASSTMIHGVVLHPDYCENLGLWSGIWGHWVIDFDEPDCETSWANFTDEGCQSTTGRRRLTATLDHFNPHDSWLVMCSTTPPQYKLNGKKLPLPSKCERGTDIVIGIWDIPDEGCPSSAALPP